MFQWLTDRRRRRLLEVPFPETCEENLAAYELLDEDEQTRLRELVQVFVDEKHWEGCGGLELDDEMRVTIAGAGCLLLMGRDHDLFSEVESILVYPTAVIVREQARGMFDSELRVAEDDKPVLGLAVKGGAVVLAWDSSLRGARDPKDGHNVVIHELAHKIDFLDGAADGTPELETYGERKAWNEAFAPAYTAHKARAERGKKSFLDDYAITNEAEYFAVATEAFFEKPRHLRRELPEVYEQLVAFYKVDLAAREPHPKKKPARNRETDRD
jgi:MtfA peptidase